MKITLKNVRLSFPDLWEATQFNGTGPFNYRAQFLIPADDPQRKIIDAAIKELAKETWKGKADAVLADILTDKKASCWIDGNRREYDGYEGMWALSTLRKQEKGRPTILDADRSPLTSKDGKPYAGCYVYAIVELWAQNNEHGKAIRCELLGVQFYKDGDSFAGGSAAADADEFEDLGAGADADAMC